MIMAVGGPAAGGRGPRRPILVSLTDSSQALHRLFTDFSQTLHRRALPAPRGRLRVVLGAEERIAGPRGPSHGWYCHLDTHHIHTAIIFCMGNNILMEYDKRRLKL
jgi:hypothetical protein